MAKLRFDLSMSLDGFITGPNPGPQNGLGDGIDPSSLECTRVVEYGKKLAKNSVTSSKISDGAVGNQDLTNSSVSAGKIQDGAVGTGKLGDAAVTAGKLASNSVTGTSIAPNSIGAGQILDGQVVEGDGRLQQIETTVLDGVNDGPVLNFPGIGALRADCVAGNTTTEFVNNSGTNIQVIKWGVINAGTDQAAIDSANPGNGAVISQSSGIGGISGITWLVSFKDTAGLHLVKIEVVTHQVIMDCVVAAQAVHTG